MEIDESWLTPDPSAEPALKKFAPDEMLTCDTCLRANAPTRGQCMYCGAPLLQLTESPATEIATIPQESPQEYVVIPPGAGAGLTDEVAGQLAARCRSKPDELRAALSAGAPVPVAAVLSAEIAKQIVGELSKIGVESVVVSETELKSGVSPINVRMLELGDDGVTAVSKNGRERVFAAWADLRLIVTGRLLTQRVEVDERRSGAAVKSLDRRELSDDKSLIDLYAVSSDLPWRLVVNDFDFSCLGDRKGLTAFDNAATLIQVLLERSNAELNGAYGRAKAVLSSVWSLENSTSEGRSRRPRATRKDFATVSTSNNEMQFNNYSRLVWYLKLRELNR